MSKCYQSWLICNRHRRSQHVYLTDLSSLNLSTHFLVLPPNYRCLWHWKMCALIGWDGSATGDKSLAAQTCCFCSLFTHFQWVTPLERGGISSAWYLWHYQLFLSPHRQDLIPHSSFCPHWKYTTSFSFTVLFIYFLCLVPLSCSGSWNSRRWVLFFFFLLWIRTPDLLY